MVIGRIGAEFGLRVTGFEILSLFFANLNTSTLCISISSSVTKKLKEIKINLDLFPSLLIQ
jgi:hypothetical protein